MSNFTEANSNIYNNSISQPQFKKRKAYKLQPHLGKHNRVQPQGKLGAVLGLAAACK